MGDRGLHGTAPNRSPTDILECRRFEPNTGSLPMTDVTGSGSVSIRVRSGVSGHFRRIDIRPMWLDTPSSAVALGLLPVSLPKLTAYMDCKCCNDSTENRDGNPQPRVSTQCTVKVPHRSGGYHDCDVILDGTREGHYCSPSMADSNIRSSTSRSWY